MIRRRAQIEAGGERAVAVGSNLGVVNTGDNAQFFLGGFEPLADAYLSPAMFFRELDLNGFVGREWLRTELDQFVEANDCGYVIVQADAGLGKTTFLANLAIIRGYAHHFAAIPRGDETALALKSLAAQLIPAWGLAGEPDWAPGGSLPTAAERPDWFYRLLEHVASRRDEHRPGEPVVVVVDGIDEVPADNGVPLGLPRLPPPGVFFVVSQRTGSPPLQVLDPRVTLTLAADDPRNLTDMHIRLEAIARDKEVAASLIPAGWSIDEFVNTLESKCAGVWVYLHYITRELQLGLRAPVDLASLPADLWAYYAQTLVPGRQHDAADRHARVALLATLGACTEPVDQGLLCRLAEMTDSHHVRSLLRHEWRPFLRVQPSEDGADSARFGAYHASLTQFLHGELEPERLSQLTAEWPLLEELRQATIAAHARIADYYLTLWGGLDRGLTELRHRPELAYVDDDFGRRHCVSQLAQAGLHEEMHALLALDWPETSRFDPSRRVNAWYWVHDRCGDLPGYLRDLRTTRRVAETATAQDPVSALSAMNFAAEIHYCLMEASILSITSSIPPALLGRLVDSGLWTSDRAVNYAREVTDPDMRCEALARIAASVEPGDVRNHIGTEALQAARSISDHQLRVSTLVGAAPHLTEAQRKEALEEAINAIWEIGDDFDRSWALAELAPHLTENQRNAVLGEALDAGPSPGGRWGWSTLMEKLAPLLSKPLLAKAVHIAQSLDDENEKARVLVTLAPHLPRPLLGEALDVVRAINDEWHRTQAIVGLAPYLGEVLLRRALLIAESIWDDPWWAETRAGLAPHLPEPMRTEMLGEAMDWLPVMDAHQRGRVLAGLAPHLSGPGLSEALRWLPGTEHNQQGEVLAGLAPHLPESLLSEALMAAQAMGERELVEALPPLAARLPESLLSEVLSWASREVGRTIDESADLVLTALAPRLSEPQVYQALEITHAISDEWARMRALVGLSKYLPEPGRTAAARDALHVAQALIEGWQEEALVELVPDLPGSLLGEALHIAQGIDSQVYRMWALGALAPPLPDLLLGSALRVLQVIRDNWERADALAALAPYLDEASRTAAVVEIVRACQAVSGDESRIEALADSAPLLSESQLSEVWNTARAIADERVRGEAVVQLARYLTGPMLREAVAVAQGIDHGWLRAQALGALAPYLNESLLEDALHAAAAASDEELRVKALAALAPYLTEPLLCEALNTAQGIDQEPSRAEVLAALAPYLTEPLLCEALNTAQGIGQERPRAKAIAALTPRLPEPQRAAILGDALQAVHVLHDAWALRALAPHLTQALLPAALYAAQSLDDSGFSVALGSLASRLSAHLLSEAVRTAAESITDEQHRAAALATLAPHLSDSQFEHALDAAQAMTDESCRAQALTAIAPHMPRSQRSATFAEALRAAQSIGDPSSRAAALANLAPHLPEAQRAAIFAAALQAARAIKSPESQAKALAELAPHLTEPQLGEALNAAHAIRDPESQAAALAALASHLPKTWRTETFAAALQAVQKISDESHRASGLRSLIPHLPDNFIDDALRVAETINGRSGRPPAFEALVPRIPDAGRRGAIRQALQGVDRNTALKMITIFAPLIAAEENHDMAGMVTESIQRTASWWP